MTMNSSGPISLAGTTAGVSIEIENGGNGTTQISLNDSAVRTLAGVPSGAITMPTNFYGKSNQFTYTVSANQTNFCMRAGAVSAGWNGSSKLVVNINSCVVVSANGTGSFGAYIQGSFPGGITLNNNGYILGMGGLAGSGGSYEFGGGSSGSNGGPALYVRSAVTINNTGVIGGGGGGGGGGGWGYSSTSCCCYYGGGGGGGGGRTGSTNSSGGGGGAERPAGGSGSAGASGTFSSGGGGGGGGSSGHGAVGGTGGSGGTWGSSGGTGASGAGGYSHSGGFSGGGGGAATCGSSTYITWSSTGTRYGAIN